MSDLERFYGLVEDLDVAMMTTRRADGHLRSRPMANQDRASGADLWFVAAEDSNKIADLANDPHLNLSYYRDSKAEWVSVSGTAEITRDRAKIEQLYKPDWTMWFNENGDERSGTKDDPRIVLVGVTIHAAEFLEIDKPMPVLLFELAKGLVTGTQPDIEETQKLTEPHRPGS